jgi:hypothetical protein
MSRRSASKAICGRNPSEASGFQKSAQNRWVKHTGRRENATEGSKLRWVGRRRVLNLSVLAYCCSQQLENLSSGHRAPARAPR